MFLGTVKGEIIKQVAHEDSCGGILFSRNNRVILSESSNHTSALLNWVAMLVQFKKEKTKPCDRIYLIL